MSSAKGAETSHKIRRNCAWVNFPYRGASSSVEHYSAPGSAPEIIPKLKGVEMVCKVSVKNRFDDKLISMSDFSKVIMI